MFRDYMIVKPVPKWVRERTRENMDKYNLDLYDAFKEAVRSYSRPSKELYNAFYNNDFRSYIPSAYLPSALETLYVCVYADDTDLFTDAEIEYDNLPYLSFPTDIVIEWYKQRKKDFDMETSRELQIPLEHCGFDNWFDSVYTADDTVGLYDFARQRGCTITRGE